MKKLSALLCVLLCILLAFAGCAAPAEQYELIDVKPYNFEWKDNGDIEKIRESIVKSILNPEVEKAQESLDALKDDGSFSNVDYDGTKTDTWHPIDHLKNVLAMQIAYNTPEHPLYHNEKIKEGVPKAMEYWAVNDFKCEYNWWWNDIGVGLYLPDIILLGVEGMSADTKTTLLKNLKGSLIQNIKYPENIKERPVDATGGNLTDQVLFALKIAVIENDGNTIMWLKSVLENELRVFPSYEYGEYTDRSDCEGIKEDMSFQQHDQLIYFGGYGEVFSDGINQYLKYTKGTQYELNEKAVNFYVDFLLDGLQYATRNEYRDVNTAGRGIVRKNGTKGNIGKGSIYANFKDAIDILLTYDNIERADELKAVLANRYGKTDLGAGGYKYFYESDVGMYNGVNYMASVRHASNKTRIYEYLNGENPLGFYGGLGATYFCVDGDEYFNALPLFNWNKVPGTTTRQNHLPVHEYNYGLYNDTKLVGGVSAGKAGVSYIKGTNEGVNSTKAYFMFPDGVVCLGTDISSVKQDKIVTTLNQTNLRGDVIFGRDGERFTLPEFSSARDNFDYVYHNKISYISANELSLYARHVKGDWKTINTAFATSSPVEGDIFTIDIFHGSRPKSAKYDYTVLMNTTPDKTESYLKNPTLITIKNDSDVQAVYDSENDILCAVFHKASSIALPDGRVIKADAPCVIALEKDILTVASNTYDSHKVSIKVDSKTFDVTATKASKEYKF